MNSQNNDKYRALILKRVGGSPIQALTALDVA